MWFLKQRDERLLLSAPHQRLQQCMTEKLAEFRDWHCPASYKSDCSARQCSECHGRTGCDSVTHGANDDPLVFGEDLPRCACCSVESHVCSDCNGIVKCSVASHWSDTSSIEPGYANLGNPGERECQCKRAVAKLAEFRDWHCSGSYKAKCSARQCSECHGKTGCDMVSHGGGDRADDLPKCACCGASAKSHVCPNCKGIVKCIVASHWRGVSSIESGYGNLGMPGKRSCKCANSGGGHWPDEDEDDDTATQQQQQQHQQQPQQQNNNNRNCCLLL
jgi:hypothetical protein